jgi:hypothetical protein
VSAISSGLTIELTCRHCGQPYTPTREDLARGPETYHRCLACRPLVPPSLRAGTSARLSRLCGALAGWPARSLLGMCVMPARFPGDRHGESPSLPAAHAGDLRPRLHQSLRPGGTRGVSASVSRRRADLVHLAPPALALAARDGMTPLHAGRQPFGTLMGGNMGVFFLLERDAAMPTHCLAGAMALVQPHVAATASTVLVARKDRSG